MAEETQAFEDGHPALTLSLIGHEAAAQSLETAAISGRLAHAWMICGPKGIGKATLAHRFARFMLANGGANSPAAEDAGPGLFGEELPADTAPQTADAPLQVAEDHPAFQRIAAGSHAGLLVIERQVDPKSGKRANQIAVDEVRKIQTFLHQTAGEGGWRIVLIDSACEMNRNAANAVLKALEEPPSKTLMLLVCHNPGRILPTIRSRCRQIALRPPEHNAVVAYLMTRAPEIAQADAERLAVMTEGSIGQSLDLISMGGLESVSEIIGLVEQIPGGLPVAPLHDLAGRLAKAGNEQQFATFGMVMRWLLEGIIRGKSRGAAPAGDLMRLEALMRAANLDRWLEVWENVGQLLDDATNLHLDRKQIVLNAFLELDRAVKRPA